MPIGIPQGSPVEVVMQAFAADGDPVVPPPNVVFLNVSYFPATGGSSTTQTIGMLPIGASFTAIWNSSAAALGQAVLSFTVGQFTLSPPDPILLINRNT